MARPGRHQTIRIIGYVLSLAAAAPVVYGAAGVRLVLGVSDQEPTPWDGSVTASGARITKLEPWRFEKEDALVNDSSWRARSRAIRLFGGSIRPSTPVVGNGVIVWLEDEREGAELRVRTAHGDFTVRLAEIPFGVPRKYLNGRVFADRVPPVQQITSSPDEQDYPSAAAGRNGDVWIAYVEFRHHPDHNRIRAALQQAPSDFGVYTTKPGGDQVFARRFSGGRWGDPIAITPPGGDLYRPGIAVDGSGRAWVFWSANQKGNFDIWARVVEGGRPGKTIQLSHAPGSDIDPAAATDSSGKVWVAWQGWRDGKAAIFAATQQGNTFSPAAIVSNSAGNEWNPAIAAGPDGRVSVAWDSYRNGNYDVYVRTAASPGRWEREIAAAATPRYEAYPSISYDPQGRLWLAYEEGGERWGKDYGAYNTSGVAIYQGRNIQVIGLDRSGRLLAPAAKVGDVLPGVPNNRVDMAGKQSAATGWERPNPEIAAKRAPNVHAVPPLSPKNTLPRLLADSSGRLWLAFRTAHPIWWTPVGTVWSEYVVSFDGKQWSGPIFLAHSDNILDNRPALVSTQAGRVLAIHSSDFRRDFSRFQQAAPKQQAAAPGIADMINDPFENDLYATSLSLPPASSSIAAQDLGEPQAASAGDASESTAIARLRSVTFRYQGRNLKIARGEFHRHSEISMDGGNDGTLLDQWRYIIDAANLDWVGCCDHDNGGGREYSWWITQKLTDIFHAPGKFNPLFSYERSVAYPEGHRNVVFAERGVRPLPRLPKMEPESTGHAPDTQMFYGYLKKFNGLVASHTSGTNMGTDWRDNDPNAEPVVEIYQGMRQNYEMPEAPRSNSEKDSIGGWRPKGFVNLALEKGYRLGFLSSSDHVSTHLSYAVVYVTDHSREAVLDGLRRRHVYGATDDILAEVTSGSYMMGDAFSTATAPELHVKLSGTVPIARVHIIKDNRYVYTTEPGKRDVEFRWRDSSPSPGKTSYYYVRGEQQNGELVWVSPMWITYTGK